MRAQGQGQRRPSILRAGSALAFVLVLLPLLGACTKGGQFDPTEIFNSDIFDSKKKLSGQREPVFPGGVPGATTGVPADLVKGYQQPPDPADADASQAPQGAAPKTAASDRGSQAQAEAKAAAQGCDRAGASSRPVRRPDLEPELRRSRARRPASMSERSPWRLHPHRIRARHRSPTGRRPRSR